jgi:hypothetical protein
MSNKTKTQSPPSSSVKQSVDRGSVYKIEISYAELKGVPILFVFKM